MLKPIASNLTNPGEVAPHDYYSQGSLEWTG